MDSPWVQAPHLASHILGKVTRTLSDDWNRMYGHPIYFAETFIDPGRFRGTCYRAANWQLLGPTTGRGKDDHTNKPNRPIKQILGLPLTRRFRELLSQRKRNTEKTSAVLPPDAVPADNPEAGESASAGHGRHGAAAFTGANQVAIAHATLHAGDRCPECLKGKVYRQKEPAIRIRFVGHAPVEATVFEMERLRCNACQQVFTADEPETAGPEKYAVTVVAMIALLKYGTGVPFKRLERLQEQLGMPLAATTQWDLVAAAAQLMRPVLEALIRLAAQGSVMHNDDTSMRILHLTREPDDKRTGSCRRPSRCAMRCRATRPKASQP